MLQGLERGPAVLPERDELPVEHDLGDLLAPHRSSHAGVRRGQVLVVPRADLDFLAVLDQQRAITVPLQLVEPLAPLRQLLDGERGHGCDERRSCSWFPGQWLFARGRRDRILSICRACRLIVSCSSS
jgi:hypothetical protein